MTEEYTIERIGKYALNSPLDSGVFIDDSQGVLIDATLSDLQKGQLTPYVLEKAGPREKIFFNPAISKAALVTCGGLCPGLNDVIRAIVMVLWYRYGIKEILGLRYGYEGLISSFRHEPLALTPELVEDIHKDGGTILGTSRGPQDPALMVDFLSKRKINMLFTIGGDGTQRGALAVNREIKKRGLAISVIGIPKTIDNDISFTERTFGFETAVAMSQAPINGAHMEAKGVKNGIGIVKLMGSDVNLVLIPEMRFSLEKVCSYLEERMSKKKHAVIVVAEGAGQEYVPQEGTDASGNKKLGDIGLFLKTVIIEYFKNRTIPVSIKYIDPSYIIRSAPATPDDSVFCFQLSENAVHAAMSGRTGMVVGIWNGHFVHIPMQISVKGRKQVDTSGLLWQSVLDNTGQPRKLA
ncbi:MAG: ATP-dependent 6-phosphofructokinase [Deltaproteobacteria bacterium]|nr:ATP-dependent 6-phosphofructokinase [Deltaproteobacteria bacterium]